MSNSAAIEYEKLVQSLLEKSEVSAGQMFGKSCAKVNGKAFLALHKDDVVFKLTNPHHQKAIAVQGAKLWDPSGKGRHMKEWVVLSIDHKKFFPSFAIAAMNYVSSSS